MSIPRHKVFISYYHKEDQKYKTNLINRKYFDTEKSQYISVFDDYSVRENDIEDEGLSSERIRCIIRDEYIKDATVLILLCGENTKRRKHVDWEIHAAMFDTEKNPKMGILVINLPSINQGCHVSDISEKPLVTNHNIGWTNFSTREEYENAYPYMPIRIIDNLVKDVPITIANWDRIAYDDNALMTLIDNAFNRREQCEYNHLRKLRKKNG